MQPVELPEREIEARLNEVEFSRFEQVPIEKWSKRSSNLLVMSQYIIGGVLASSFVQGLLNPPWVGVLGVLVLVASLFKQQFPLYSTKELPRGRTIPMR